MTPGSTERNLPSSTPRLVLSLPCARGLTAAITGSAPTVRSTPSTLHPATAPTASPISSGVPPPTSFTVQTTRSFVTSSVGCPSSPPPANDMTSRRGDRRGRTLGCDLGNHRWDHRHVADGVGEPWRGAHQHPKDFQRGANGQRPALRVHGPLGGRARGSHDRRGGAGSAPGAGEVAR